MATSNALAFWLLIGGIVLLLAGLALIVLVDLPRRSYERIRRILRVKGPQDTGD